MLKNEALQEMKKELHVSYTELATYLNCPLKHQFAYVLKRPPERLSISLLFGSAIHASLERFYRTMRDQAAKEPLGVLQELFQDRINHELDRTEVPLIFKKETPDRETAVTLGHSMLKAFHESLNLDGFEVLEVERPLSARLYTDEGLPTELKLIGVLDLVLKDEKGCIIAVDNKTASKPYAQDTVGQDMQLTCYSYLLASNRYVFPTADVHCRLDVLRKLKTPKVEHYSTVRTAAQRRRFAKLATAVLAAIEGKAFYPQPSWMCGDCGFSEACRAW
jgi:putative RecB family exonuclease